MQVIVHIHTLSKVAGKNFVPITPSIGWLRGIVAERWSFGRRTSLSCAQPVAAG